MSIIRKTTEKINMRPSGIRWEDEDICLVTPAGVVHTSKGDRFALSGTITPETIGDFIKTNGKKRLSDNFIMANVCYGATGYDINVVEKDDPNDSYLSILSFSLGKTSDSVASFEKGMGIKPLSLDDTRFRVRYSEGLTETENRAYWWSDSDRPTGTCGSASKEIRVYRDQKIAVLYGIRYPSGSFRCYIQGNGANEYKKFHVSEDEWFGGEFGVTEVFTDAEVRAHARRNTKKDRLIERGTHMLGSDLNVSRRARNSSSYDYYRLPKQVTDEINSFLGVFAPENEAMRSMFDKDYGSIKGYCARSAGEGIASLIYLDRWTLCTKASSSKAADRARSDKALWDSISWPKVPKDGGNHRHITWERRHGEDGDLIIAAYVDYQPKGSWRWRDCSTSAAFIYDVRGKTRKVLIGKTADPLSLKEGEVSNAIPSLANCILKNFDLSPRSEYDYDKRALVVTDEGPAQEIVGGITVKELFAGTNIGWILGNEAEFGDDMVYLFDGERSRYRNSAEPRRIQDDIREGGRIGVVAICVLATTGNAMLEQLLKSRMFRLYFLALYSEQRQSSVFLDTAKKLKVDPRPSFRYSSKGKNLKEMFGMSLAQLRMVDRSVSITMERDGAGNARYRYSFPNLSGVAEVLGVSRLSDLNEAMMGDVIEVSQEKAMDRPWYILESKETVFEKFRKRDLIRTVANNTPKERLELMKSFSGVEEVDLMGDYYIMRERLKALQAARPDEAIFDEREFPAKVGRGVKFIRFMPGMRPAGSWNGAETGWHPNSWGIGDQRTFIDFIRARYARYATERGSIQLELSETGKVLGAIVKMNRAQHCVFLHDELSQWFSLYEDDSCEKEFGEAADRVSGLCWEDKTTGLSVIRPERLSDLRREGSVLEHCVASYVHPIISGGHNIMFIRRTDMIAEPYYTLDVSPEGDVTEIHGYRNCNMEDSDVDKAYAETKRDVYSRHFDIKGFLRNWAKAMKGKINAKSIRDSYGKLDIAM